MQKEDVVLSAFANAFRTPDLRRKLLFVLMILGDHRTVRATWVAGACVYDNRRLGDPLRYPPAA